MELRASEFHITGTFRIPITAVFFVFFHIQASMAMKVMSAILYGIERCAAHLGAQLLWEMRLMLIGLHSELPSNHLPPAKGSTFIGLSRFGILHPAETQIE